MPKKAKRDIALSDTISCLSSSLPSPTGGVDEEDDDEEDDDEEDDDDEDDDDEDDDDEDDDEEDDEAGEGGGRAGRLESVSRVFARLLPLYSALGGGMYLNTD
jgi:ABC-type Zn2+ transport system substrate-binding protein/surface adhesin